MENTKTTLHIMEMAYAKDGLGITASKSKKNEPLFSGTFQECVKKKKEFIENPQLITKIKKDRDQAKAKEEKKLVSTLIKKHRK